MCEEPRFSRSWSGTPHKPLRLTSRTSPARCPSCPPQPRLPLSTCNTHPCLRLMGLYTCRAALPTTWSCSSVSTICMSFLWVLRGPRHPLDPAQMSVPPGNLLSPPPVCSSTQTLVDVYLTLIQNLGRGDHSPLSQKTHSLSEETDRYFTVW